MKCPKCNETNHEPNARFCHVCGTTLQSDDLEENRQIAADLFNRSEHFLKDHDWEKALPDIMESAILGDSRAQLALYNFFRERAKFNYYNNNGKGVLPNELESFRWALSSARLGNRVAQWIVGVNYLYGYDTEPNDELAFYWLQKSASNGSPQGLAYLGACYVLGISVPVNKILGDQLINEAATKGSISAKNMLEGWAYPTRKSLDEVRKKSKEELK